MTRWDQRELWLGNGVERRHNDMKIRTRDENGHVVLEKECEKRRINSTTSR
jgi:hypothetical protein